ncbi:MAG: alpha/beta hydrolase, partial [Oligoflexia bacterium]|nr:alpha/beta hydrolase [Oligoflexia bacterium]
MSHTPANTDKPTFVLIHGLGDSMEDLDAIAKRITAEGFGVLRVDLHGHGMTLENFLKRHELPKAIDYIDQLDDLEELIVKQLRLRNIALVGHSYGGGISLGLAARLENQLNVLSVTQMSPYVVRLDSHAKDPYFS